MLRISRLTDHAIVVLAHLSRKAHVCVHPAAGIADETAIPQPTVAKVFKQLTRGGLLISTRGAAGGYSLARDPAEISVADVVTAMEGPLSLTACAIEGLNTCDHGEHCQISGHWPLINQAVYGALADVSMLDLARPVPGTQTLHIAHGGA